MTSLDLAGPKNPSVRLSVLKSLRSGNRISRRSESSSAGLGISCSGGGQRTGVPDFAHFHPSLANLVAGVRALEKGDFRYALDAHGGDEAAEVTGLRPDARQLEENPAGAAGSGAAGHHRRMASSISHDLRHSLAAIVADVEFLCESKLSSDQREELYQEVRIFAVNQTTDLIDSLLEFSRSRESLRPALWQCQRLGGARGAGHPGASGIPRVRSPSARQAAAPDGFDPKKLERALQPIAERLRGSCAGGRQHQGGSERSSRRGQIPKICDNGRGIPELIRGKLFEPFISYGKETGPGWGSRWCKKSFRTMEAT